MVNSFDPKFGSSSGRDTRTSKQVSIVKLNCFYRVICGSGVCSVTRWFAVDSQ